MANQEKINEHAIQSTLTQFNDLNPRYSRRVNKIDFLTP